MTYTLSATLHRPYAEAVEAVRPALAEQGFGVLTEIDLAATLKAKLDVDVKELDQVSQHLDSREVSFEPRAGAPEDSYPLSERIAAEQDTPEERAVEAEMVGAVAQFVDGFLTDERERAVWIEHLAAEEPVSLGVLGERFGVTKQRMGQIADKLKKRFREEIVRDLGEGIQTDWLRERD